MNQNQKDLTRRYLIWCYKTTKEDLDRIDRYFTQYDVDQQLLKTLKGTKEFKSSSSDGQYKELVEQFEKYLHEKKAKAQEKKFAHPSKVQLTHDYLYLRNRLESIEKAVVHFLGKKELKSIRLLYEGEMTRRILEAREHT
jgi:hypothetical protein